jgi:hypothetical protein
VQVINGIVSFAVSIGIIIAVLIAAYAGFLLVINPVAPENREKAKGMFINAAIGLVIVLASWLIVNTVLGILGAGDVNTLTSQVLTGGDTCIQVKTTPSLFSGSDALGVTGTGTTPSGVTATPVSGDESAVRQKFSAAGVSVNKSACPNGYKYSDVSGGCTSVGGMRQATVDQVIAIKNAVGSGITVTGGSELGHASGTYSHGNGYKVDLSQGSAALNAYLNGLTHTGSRGGDSGGLIYTDKCGNQYVQESDHWDVTVYKVCDPPK